MVLLRCSGERRRRKKEAWLRYGKEDFRRQHIDLELLSCEQVICIAVVEVPLIKLALSFGL